MSPGFKKKVSFSYFNKLFTGLKSPLSSNNAILILPFIKRALNQYPISLIISLKEV